ncbi:MAG: hypothetical protein J1E98_02740 [Lachnospiraceae bacterium]|nr:hypothetical protein [Lachnospiraceae bacterium]MCH5256150.1 hypothetical protein [Lachnospiraceae bacterium]
MLNEERVILMTKLASYEAGEGKKNVAIGSYFRSDYIGWQVLKSIISATIAFVVVFAMLVFYDFEAFMTDIYKMDLLDFCKTVLIWYVTIVGIYAVLSYIIYTYRYSKARKSLRLYYRNLKKLSNMYDDKL